MDIKRLATSGPTPEEREIAHDRTLPISYSRSDLIGQTVREAFGRYGLDAVVQDVGAELLTCGIGRGWPGDD
jgi:hypothetical protein